MPEAEIVTENDKYIDIPGLDPAESSRIQYWLQLKRDGLSNEEIARILGVTERYFFTLRNKWGNSGALNKVEMALEARETQNLSIARIIVLEKWGRFTAKLMEDAMSNNTSAKTRLEIWIALKERLIDDIANKKPDPGAPEFEYVKGQSGNFSPTEIPAQVQTSSNEIPHES